MKILLLTLCLSAPFWMIGQTLKIFNSSNATEVTNGQITVSDSYNADEIVVLLKVKNTSTQSQSLYAKKRMVSNVTGTDLTYCFAGSCYTPTIPVSSTISLGANATDSSFSSHYAPLGQSGITIVNYTFYVVHGDSASVQITYNATSASVPSYSINTNYISAPSPNPASSFTSFNYSLKSSNKAYITVHNILGNEIKRTELNTKSGAVQINTADLTAGMYFCSFVSEGKVVKTVKFSVAR